MNFIDPKVLFEEIPGAKEAISSQLRGIRVRPALVIYNVVHERDTRNCVGEYGIYILTQVNGRDLWQGVRLNPCLEKDLAERGLAAYYVLESIENLKLALDRPTLFNFKLRRR